MRFLYRHTDRHACNPARIRTKINYKVSITLYMVAVKSINTIYRCSEWRNAISCSGYSGNCKQSLLYVNRDQDALILQYPDFLFQDDLPACRNHSRETGPWRGRHPDIRCQGRGGRLFGNKNSNIRPALSSPVSPKAG